MWLFISLCYILSDFYLRWHKIGYGRLAISFIMIKKVDLLITFFWVIDVLSSSTYDYMRISDYQCFIDINFLNLKLYFIFFNSSVNLRKNVLWPQVYAIGFNLMNLLLMYYWHQFCQKKLFITLKCTWNETLDFIVGKLIDPVQFFGKFVDPIFEMCRALVSFQWLHVQIIAQNIKLKFLIIKRSSPRWERKKL